MTRTAAAWLGLTLVLTVAPLLGPTTTTAHGGGCGTLLDPIQNDAGTGTDASDDPQEPTRIDRDVPYRGFLLPVELGVYHDTLDAYGFTVDDDRSILVEVTTDGPTPLEVFLIDPAGATHPVPGAPQTAELTSSLTFAYATQLPNHPGDWTLVLQTAPPSAPVPTPAGLPCLEATSSASGAGAEDYDFEVDGCSPWCGT